MPRTELELALTSRDKSAVAAALAKGEDVVNQPFDDGLTALCRTAALGEWRILKLLLAAKANVDAVPTKSTQGSAVAEQVTEAGFAALHWACREGKAECVKLLLGASAAVDVRATEGVTPFMLACKASHYECAILLARAGADVEAANLRGGSALIVACVMGHVETIRLLLSLGANADAKTVAVDDSEQLFQCRPLMTACRYDQPKVVGALLAAGVSVEAMENALVELESFPGHKACLALVLRALGRKGGGLKGVATEAAEAKAEAAMAELIAEEEHGGGGGGGGNKAAKKKRQKMKKGAKGVTQVEPSSAALPVETEAEAAPPVAGEAEEEKSAAFISLAADSGEGTLESNMNVLASEFRTYQQARSAHAEAKAAAKAAAKAGSKAGPGTEDPHAGQVMAAAPAARSPGADSINSSENGSPGSATSVVSVVSDAQKQSDIEQLDSLVQHSRASRDLSHLDTFLHRKKFCGDAIESILSRVREGARERDVELKAAREADNNNVLAVPSPEAALAAKTPTSEAEAGKADGDGPPTATASDRKKSPASRPVAVDVTEEEEEASPLSAAQRRRKARRPPPPADLLPSPKMLPTVKDPPIAKKELFALPSSPEQLRGSSLDAPWTLVARQRPARRAPACAGIEGSSGRTFSELERRLEEELLVARQREAALQSELQQRTQALSELALCPITHEPMVDPVMTADGQTYERKAIEEWLQRSTGEDGCVPTSPLTGEPLKDTTLRPNYLARELGYAAVAN